MFDKKAYKRRYYLDHREELIERQRKYHQEHREEEVATRKRWYQKHRAEVIAASKQYRDTHKKQCVDCGVPISINAVRCLSCANKANNSSKNLVPYQYKGGAEHPNYKEEGIRSDGYFWTHRPNGSSVKRAVLVLEEELGRPIRKGYDSHHIDTNPLNDAPWNLEEKIHTRHGIEHAYHWNDTPVNQYDLEGNFIASYPSQSEAARQTGVNQPTISQACLDNRKTAGGFGWQFNRVRDTSVSLITK